jgi:hypothetical protein
MNEYFEFSGEVINDGESEVVQLEDVGNCIRPEDIQACASAYKDTKG